MAQSILDQMLADAGAPVAQPPNILEQMKADSGAPAQPPAAPAKKGFWPALGDAVYDGAMGVVHRLEGVPAATEQRGWGGNLLDAGSALVHNVRAPLIGLDQKANNGIAYLAHQVAPGTQFDRNLQVQTQAGNQRLQAWERDYQNSTPDSAGAMFGATAGQVLPWAKLPAAGQALDVVGTTVSNVLGAPTRMAATAAKAVPYVGPAARVVARAVDAAASGGAKGATIATTMPASSGGTTPADVLGATATDALVGSVLGVAGRGAGAGLAAGNEALVKPVLRVANPARIVGENLPRIAGVDPADYVAALRGPGAAEWVPGSLPSVAQAGAQGLGANNVPVVQLEKWMRSNVPTFLTKFDQRGVQNNDARLGALSQVAGTDADLQAAKAARQAAVGPKYQEAYATPVTADAGLDAITGTQAFPAAVERAQRLAGNEIPPREVVVQHPTEPTVRASSILDANGNPVTVYTAPATPGQYSVQGLHDTIGALGLMEGDQSLGLVGKESRAIGNIRRKLTDWLTTASPDFADAQQTYAQHSVPVNNMEAGQTVLNGLQGGSASGGGNPAMQLRNFRNLVNKATNPELVDYPSDASTQAVFDNIGKDLQRATVSNAGGPPNSSTALNMRSDDWVSKLLNDGSRGDPSGTANTLAGAAGTVIGGPAGAGGALYGVGKVSSWLNHRLLEAYEDALLNPASAADLIEKYMPSSAVGPLSSVPAAAAPTVTSNSPP